MPVPDELLQPIPGPNPAGVDLRGTALWETIREARREDDPDLPPPGGEPPKRADWTQVVRLTSDALAKQSKDLELAAWLTEGLLRKDGFGGLRDGLALVTTLLDQFWEHVYPTLDEDGDAGYRAAKIGWLAEPRSLRRATLWVPLTAAGYSRARYEESRKVGYEADCAGDSDKLDARSRAINEQGKLPPEEFDRSLASTPKPFYKQLVADLAGCIAALDALDTISSERFAGDAPSLRPLREELETVERLARTLLARKLETDPDVPEQTATQPEAAASAAPTAAATPASTRARRAGAEPADREDAAARVVEAARFLRRTEPHNPSSYLLLRGFRWGELQAGGGTIDPKLLEAPAPTVRTQLKHLLLDAHWSELLDAAETAMGTPAGRGWLDLQRYVLTACEGLGRDYYVVGETIRRALQALLADVPSLVTASLMDDTPAANPDTQAWLACLLPQPGAAPDDPAPSRPFAAGPTNGRDGKSVHDRALAEARAGRPERGIELLLREQARERSRRARFLRRVQVASLMVDAHLETVALPILEELEKEIETFRLEEWEDSEVVATPLGLLYRCLTHQDLDPTRRQSLYLRICRLDPLQAITFAHQ